METKSTIIEKLKALAEKEELPLATELNQLKGVFYQIQNAEYEQQKQQYLEAHPDQKDYVPPTSAEELLLKDIMNIFKERRQELVIAREKDESSNLEQKKEIIAQIKALVEDSGNVGRNFTKYKELQAEWKAIGRVPAQYDNDLWKEYQIVAEQFYDKFKLYKEFQDYDFRKNLEIKTGLCEAVERLAEEPDPIAAYHAMTKLQQTWRETGPIAKELREELGIRFKNATTAINKRHAQYFEGQKQVETENYDKKVQLCETIEAIDLDSLKTLGSWQKKAEAIIEIQKQYKAVGNASRKRNAQIYERFRKACDNFFTRKLEVQKALRALQGETIAKKRALCEQVEALKESTEWAEVTAQFVDLQKQWKEIGHTTGKLSDELWDKFHNACNYFFERKKADSQQKFANNRPARGKGAPNTFSKGRPSEAGSSLQRQHEAVQKELRTYETNIGFLKSSSKSGNKLVEAIEKKVEALKAKLVSIEEQIAQSKKKKEEPVVETPAPEAPTVETPAAEEPIQEAPATETPAPEVPAATEAPAAEEPTAETPEEETANQ